MKSILRAWSAILLLPALSGTALAHPGDHAAGGLLAGASHPLLGWDHLLAVFAVGLWAARRPAVGAAGICMAWLTGMAAGMLLALGFAMPPALTGGPAVMLLLTGLLLAGALRLSARFVVPVVALVACFHGITHAGALPAAVISPPLYLAGLLAVTTGLLGIALAAGCRAREHHVRMAGVGMVAAGSWLLFAG